MRPISLVPALLFVSGALAAPDIVIHNALVWTGHPDAPSATAFAIDDGRFVVIGEDAEALGAAGPETVVIDAGGRRIVPGMIDAHLHLTNAALSMEELDLRPATSRDDLLRRVTEAARSLPEDAWLLARGWSAESWPDDRLPSADEIADAAGGRKALLTRMDGHMLIASRAALEAAGINASGPADPSGGRISRGADGVPDGALYDEAMPLVFSLVPGDSIERNRELMRRAVAEANSMGLTQVGAIESRSWIENVLVPMDEAGELTLRVRAAVSEDETTTRGWLHLIKWALGARTVSERVQVVGFKGYMDGSLGSRTAWMHAPYADDQADPQNTGLPGSLAASGELGRLIEYGAKVDVQPWVHAIGDRANTVLLDWYGSIPADIRRGLRPRIEHAQHLTPMDIQRIAGLGVVASMQPLHKADDGRYAEQRIGAERCATSYAFRALLDAGAHLAFGSDWPVVSCSPWLGIEAAVTSRTLDGQKFVPEQAITVEEALRAYTTGGAFSLHTEGRTGAIRPGYFADFVILDRDVLSIPHEELGLVQAMETWVEGERVYVRDAE